MYRSSENTENIMKAFIAAAVDIQSIPKSKAGYNNRYKYATLDSLIDMLRGVLPKHGLWFTQYPCDLENDIELITRVVHNSGEWFETSITMKISDISGASAAQNVGGAITYFRRYTLSCIFGVSCDEDTDAQPDPLQTQTKQPAIPKAVKCDAHQYLSKTIDMRSKAGEPIGSIMQDFADILGVDSVKSLETMTPEEKSKVANCIYKRNK